MTHFFFRYLSFFLFLLANSSFAQINDISQAEQQETTLKKLSYTQQMEVYKQLISFYSKNSLEKSILLSEQMLGDAKKMNDFENQAEALNFLGRSHIRSGNFDIAKKCHIDAYLFYQKTDNISGQASQLGNLGVISEFTGKLPEALSFYQEALTIYQSINDHKSVSFVHNNIAIVYQTMGLFDPALKHQKKAYSLKKELNDTSGMASTLNNIGVLYESVKEDFDKALFYYLQSLALYESIKNNLQTGTLYNNIGLIYFRINQFQEAQTYYEKAFAMRNSLGDVFGAASTQLNMAQLKLKLNNTDESIKLADTCLAIFLTSKSKLKIAETYHFLSQAYEQKGDLQKALKNHQNYSIYRDSILNENNQKIIHEMQARFDNETNLQKLQLLEKDNALKRKEIISNRRLIFGILLLSISLTMILVFYSRQHQLRLKHRHLIAEQKLFRTQMNPHFIFNALSSVQAFVLDNDTETGSKYITRFARMMRKILDFSSKDFIPLSDEIELLKEYVAFQKLRFNNSFNVVFEINDNIEIDLIGVPPMIIQPFVENAIEHGVREIQHGIIKISVFENKNQIFVEITDNGIGINKSKQKSLSQKHFSKALDITNERLKLLSKDKKQFPKVNITDLSENSIESGTKVTFELPTKNI